MTHPILWRKPKSVFEDLPAEWVGQCPTVRRDPRGYHVRCRLGAAYPHSHCLLEFRPYERDTPGNLVRQPGLEEIIDRLDWHDRFETFAPIGPLRTVNPKDLVTW